MEIGTHAGQFGFLILLSCAVLIEATFLIFGRKQEYEWGHSAASLGVAFIKRVVDALTAGATASILFWVYDLRLYTFELDTIWKLGVAFIAVEFAYYWHHRWAHEIRWLWATHGVHHTAPYMNLSVAGRLGWTGLLSGTVLFFAPLVLFGLHPYAVFLMLAAGLFYQIWIHTELVPRLGILEYIFNTPSNHRVHHGSNPEYLDKNYGGVLIIFDLMFGTYAKEERENPVIYGTVNPMISKNPIAITLFEWRQILQDTYRARNITEIFMYMFGRPGWKPKGSHKLTQNMPPHPGD
mgnify:CR=1 FL=1